MKKSKIHWFWVVVIAVGLVAAIAAAGGSVTTKDCHGQSNPALCR